MTRKEGCTALHFHNLQLMGNRTRHCMLYRISHISYIEQIILKRRQEVDKLVVFYSSIVVKPKNYLFVEGRIKKNQNNRILCLFKFQRKFQRTFLCDFFAFLQLLQSILFVSSNEGQTHRNKRNKAVTLLL